MNDSQTTRRRFLLAALAFSTTAVTGTTWLRGAAAWASSTEGTNLARFGRLLFPHDGLADDVYTEVMDNVLTALAANPATEDALVTAEQALDAQYDTAWIDRSESEQITAIENTQGEAYFDAIVGAVRGAFYYNPAVWSHIHYPGSSKEHGGYKFRGFDDIDWLPGDV